jgi:serine/threonine protein kinase
MPPFEGKIIIDKLPEFYQIDFTKRLEAFSSPFADAFLVKDNSQSQDDKIVKTTKYALVFQKNFPADLEKIFRIKDFNSEAIGIIDAVGKVTNQLNGNELLTVILSLPKGVPLSEIIAQKGALDEGFVLNVIFEQIFYAVSYIHSMGVIHGGLNINNIFYDNTDGKIYLKESFSEYVGYSQPKIYEPYERMVCHKAAKGSAEFDADFYAMGIVLISIIFGEEPLSTMAEDLIENIKFENGSFEALYNMSRLRKNIIISPRAENVVKGLLHDRIRDRWGEKEVRSWVKRESGQSILSKVHKQGSATFEFNGTEYFSPKYLAQAIFKNWAYAKKYIKLSELSRWLNLTTKDPEIEKKLFALTRGGRAEVILPDDKITRIIYILDSEGPIRFRNTSITPSGLGNYLSYIIKNNEIDALKEFIEILDNGLIDGWIAQQHDQTLYKFANLGWSPRKIRIYAKKANVGFGLERCLYELCRFLPCQSQLIDKFYTISVPTLLKSLNNLKVNFKEVEPLDSHIAAFICRDLEVEDNIKIKQLANFPLISKMREVEVAAILSMAQKKYNVTGLENLCFWLRARLSVISDRLNSNVIRKQHEDALDEVAKQGDLYKIFFAAINENIIRKDIIGFREAKKQYKFIGFERFKLQSQRNLDKMAYRMGLRVAVLTAYLICAIAVVAVFFLNM